MKFWFPQKYKCLGNLLVEFELLLLLLIETKSHNLCLGKFYILVSQEKNSFVMENKNLASSEI